jgi:ribosomal protein L12E/L44/L45/RPP1/RPP2
MHPVSFPKAAAACTQDTAPAGPDETEFIRLDEDEDEEDEEGDDDEDDDDGDADELTREVRSLIDESAWDLPTGVLL